MSITLSYLSDLSRVRVALSGLPDGTVQIQRAANGSATDALWQRGIVRGAKALPIESGSGQVDDYEFFADVATHYRAVPVDPPAGLLAGTGTASTPDDASLDITGDITLIAHLTTGEWESASLRDIVRKWDFGTPDLSYRFRIGSSDTLNLLWSTDGSTSEQETSTVAPTPDDSGELVLAAELDVDNGASGHDVRFWTAPSVDGPWTQLGDTITGAGTSSIASSAAPLVCNEGNSWDHSNHRTQVWSGLAITDPGSATLVADPRFDQQDGGATSFDDSLGLTWTIAGDAEIVGIWQDSITASLGGEVWLKSIKYPALNRPLFRVLDRDPTIGRAARAGLSPIVGRSAPSATHDVRGSQQFTIFAQVADEEAAGEMDVILAAGGTRFIHVPAEMQGKVSGGYVSIGDTGQVRQDSQARWVFRLPCTVVTPPAPGVTGTLLTGDTVLRLYGSGQALISAHSTGRSLLQTMLDPDDLVTL